ncbi:hypothetical protein BD413DRAFT_669404 [Trametes elegans]|nr:hypothetical protein BD413DRAFT_669404 [Trametes elegans]
MVTKKICTITPAEFVRILLGTAASDRDGVYEASDAQLQHPTANPFAELPEANSEEEMSEAIANTLKESGLCPDHVFAVTPHKEDKSAVSGRAIDLGMYPLDPPQNLGTADEGKFLRTDWLTIEVGIECKMNSTAQDPFDESHDGDEFDAISRRKVLDRLLSSLELIAQHQQRTFQYMVLFLGAFARILRADPSGIFVTDQFDYRGEDGLILVNFFRNLGRASPARRGFDITATRVSPRSAEGKEMLRKGRDVGADDYVKQMFLDSLDFHWPWWKLEVPDETAINSASAGPAAAAGKCGSSKTRSYLVGKPYFQAPGVTGRFTRGHVALDVTDPGRPAQFVFLKDAWRVVSDGIEKEGIVLETLKRRKVQFIPTVLCHGDITGQRSISQDHWQKYHKGKKCELKTHQHYRLVVKEVCKPLDQFRNGSQLALAMWCCLKAHSQAYKLGIIHRDISAGNILLYRTENGKWQGMLNDWEMSKTRAQQELEGRLPDRTGTWQFLSVNALARPAKTIIIQDELESFFHVLLYVAIRLLHHNFDDHHVPQFLREYFDGYIPLITRNTCGALKREVMTTGRILLWSEKDQKDVPPKKLLFISPSSDNAPTAGHDGNDESGSSSLQVPAQPNQSPGNDETLQQSEGSQEPSASPPSTAPAPNYNHPLNHIVAKLLSWFKAYYTLQESDHDEPAVKRNVQPRAMTEDALQLSALDGDDYDLASEHSDSEDSESSSSAAEDASEDAVTDRMHRRALKKNAKNLRSHGPILQLFKDAVYDPSWPVADRYPDRKPDKKWKPAGDLVPKQSTFATSAKRPAIAVDDLEPPRTPPKRSRA